MNHTTLAVAANMAARAYDSTAQIAGFEITQHVQGNIQWFAARDACDLWIVFRGTDEGQDWVDNLKVKQSKTARGYVHKGFNDALDRVWPSVVEEIEARWTRHLHFVGHSLGGALATIAASRCPQDPINHAHDFHQTQHIYLFTFGQPRCGNKPWADWMGHRLGQRYVRVFNAGDIVPHLPTFVRFRHAGSELFFDEHGAVVTPTFSHRVWAAINVILTQFPSSIVRLGAHSMGRYRDNVLRLIRGE